jgi:hypothetical protein
MPERAGRGDKATGGLDTADGGTAMKAILILLLVLAAISFALWIWRQSDHRADRTARRLLTRTQPADPRLYDPQMVAGLPEPARRFFAFAIAPGTPLLTVAEIEMKGLFNLGSKEAPNTLQMTARQVLAAPEGFIWSMTARRGALRVSGSDAAFSGRSWTRFWLLNQIPVARSGDDQDHRRSAFGRYVSEAVFWTPAALLPGDGILWEQVGPDAAQVTIHHDGLEQSVEVRVDEAGRPVEVQFLRWSNANSDKVYRQQPFGGYLSQFREFGGFRLPTQVEAGNHFGTAEYFPFFIAEITRIHFPGSDGVSDGRGD